MSQTNTLPAPVERKPLTLRDHLAKMQPEFAKALPGHIPADKFVRTAQTAIALTRNIDKVRNPQSLLAACTKAAADGLILDGREAALVVDHNGDVQYRPMMRGLLKLAYNSGMVSFISVQPVCINDVFSHRPSDPKPINHEIDYKQPRGDVYLVYAISTLKDGAIVHEVMTVAAINRIRDRSDAYRAFKANKIKSTPWHTDWEEMARKTVFRRLSKYLPSSSDRDALHQAAERIDEDYSIQIDAEPVTEPQARTQPERKKRGGAAAALKDVTPKKEAKPEPENRDGDDYDPETGEIIDYDGPDQGPGDDI
jgi:recombination protein RecT